MNRSIVAVLFAILGFARPAIAAEPTDPAEATAPRLTVNASALPPLASDTDWSLSPLHLGGPKRGALLSTLYVSYATLNAYDAYSTTKGLRSGATERNPLMRGIAGNSATFWALKGGVTAGSIAMAERLWKADRRKAAVAVMVIANGMMAAVAAQNASVLRHAR